MQTLQSIQSVSTSVFHGKEWGIQNGIFCLVTIRNTAIKRAAKMARYNASSPEETGMFRTKGPNVPNRIIDAISIQYGFVIQPAYLTSQYSHMAAGFAKYCLSHPAHNC